MGKMKKLVFDIVFEIKRRVNNLRYSEESRKKNQVKIYNRLGLNRSDGLSHLNRVLKELGRREYTEKEDMCSEHLIIMGAISAKKSKEVRNILEIGTYDGVTAVILSKLFEDARIRTIDLPSQDTTFTGTYKRERTSSQFVVERNRLIDRIRSIYFEEVDSIHLSMETEKYDLIWIDGAHGFPMISIDICNGIRLLKKDGVMLSDDIIKDKYIKEDSVYTSRKGYQMLETYDRSGITRTEYFLKRLEDEHMKIIKYVAYTVKTREDKSKDGC